jgi:hypothetical protein
VVADLWVRPRILAKKLFHTFSGIAVAKWGAGKVKQGAIATGKYVGAGLARPVQQWWYAGKPADIINSVQTWRNRKAQKWEGGSNDAAGARSERDQALSNLRDQRDALSPEEYKKREAGIYEKYRKKMEGVVVEKRPEEEIKFWEEESGLEMKSGQKKRGLY